MGNSSYKTLAMPPEPQVPAVQWQQIGQKVTGAVSDVAEKHDLDFSTGEPKFWPNGDKVMVTRVGLVVTSAEGGVTASDEEIREWDHVRIWVRGRNRKNWAAMLRTTAEGLTLGSILTAHFAGTEQTKRGWSPRKIVEFSVRDPQLNDSEFVARAVELHENANAVDEPF